MPRFRPSPWWIVVVGCGLLHLHHAQAAEHAARPSPYQRQIAEQVSRLQSDRAWVRAGAAEALGFLRAYEAEHDLIAALHDSSFEVQCQAALALAWCGGRASVEPLIDTLASPNVFVRQAAWVALENLTGMEFPFDGTASLATREAQQRVWRDWWRKVPADRPPADVLALARTALPAPNAVRVSVSSIYRGPAEALIDGDLGGAFWQTKNVPFPQWCMLDLGKPKRISRVVVHQYGPRFVMTDYEVAASLDGVHFKVLRRARETSPVHLVVDFPPCLARFIRITSYGSKNPTYPTTFFEVRAMDREQAQAEDLDTILWKRERGVRALGALGGHGASAAVIASLGRPLPMGEEYRAMVQAGLRALGRLREPDGYEFLLGLLEQTHWARYAAQALGDFGDARAVPALIEAFRKYAKRLDGGNPTAVPKDDVMGFPSEDRMLETPYAIAFALSRLVTGTPAERAALAELAPLLMANLPGDHDTFFLYEPEVAHRLIGHLMELSGERQEACEVAFVRLAQPRRMPAPPRPLSWPKFPPERMASWLPCVCTDPADLPRLVALLDHTNGWVRLNAAKTLAWLGDRRAIEPLAQRLATAPAEADFGYSGRFKDEEYNDPAPRWREGLIRALGRLGAHEHTDLLIRIMEDERSVVDVRHAAAQALAELGNTQAQRALQRAAVRHPFLSVRNVARDALRRLGVEWAADALADNSGSMPRPPAEPQRGLPDRTNSRWEALVFIKGSNNIPNTLGTVEQADRWRQTYVVTDSGPAYRPGRNLYVLRPPRPDGEVIPLTHFADGYVAEPEVAWDGTQVVFTRRGQDDPWWHIYRIRVDGTGLEQLTHGPYHHVGPAFLPDGRIVFASSRSGIRDEYHGYPCTALHVMNSDGTGLRCIATNIGRDNEPALLWDGRIVFSRLEVFYSRNKTELTLHAVYPDGWRDVVLYGPERRAFWRNLDHGPRTPADVQEVPLTHRVLRMTQPQPMPDGQHVVVATQGGLTLVGQTRLSERIVSPDNKRRAYTTPYPLPDGQILCASTFKTPDRAKVDLGLYLLDPETGELTLIYNDPSTADFEPRPILARRPPPRLVEESHDDYSGAFLCAHAFNTQEKLVAQRGRLVRLIEGMPMPARHSTQTNPHEVWKNHGGTLARVLGMAPLLPDGSFYVEAPADRLVHFQVLDSDRRVVGNQLTWIYTRPRETRSCAGCHERPDTAALNAPPLAVHYRPLDFRPRGDEFTYRAKAWFKGYLPSVIEERTRTARAVNLLAR